MTLDEFVNADGVDWGSRPFGERAGWPKGAVGFRIGRRGRVIWETAHYPDGSDGNNILVSRIVSEGGRMFTRVAYYDRESKIEFVFKPTTPGVPK